MSEQEQEQEQPQEGEQPEPQPEPGEPSEEEQEGDEQETQDQDGPGEVAEDVPPQAIGAVGEKEIEKMMKRIETANTTYRKRVAEIMGEEVAVLEPCPRCADPVYGAIWPATMKPVTPEVKDAVLVSVGESAGGATKETRFARRCDECDGWGVVLTGSRTNRDRTIACPTCKSRGWIPVGDELRVGRPDIPAVAQSNGHDEVAEQPPDADPWGRTPADPDYGRMPQYVRS